jgi:glutaredoxin
VKRVQHRDDREDPEDQRHGVEDQNRFQKKIEMFHIHSPNLFTDERGRRGSCLSLEDGILAIDTNRI